MTSAFLQVALLDRNLMLQAMDAFLAPVSLEQPARVLIVYVMTLDRFLMGIKRNVYPVYAPLVRF
jgi:hypothetical protein